MSLAKGRNKGEDQQPEPRQLRPACQNQANNPFSSRNCFTVHWEEESHDIEMGPCLHKLTHFKMFFERETNNIY